MSGITTDQKKALLLAVSGLGVLGFALAPTGFLIERLRLLGLSIRHPDANLSLDAFIKRQSGISWKNLLANIHPRGTAPGCIVASPSQSKPDYWFQWTRDSALVMRNIVRKYKEGEMEMFSMLTDFVDATIDMQHRETPSGGYRTGGLGEVKFHVDRTPFTDNWGRPQHDGPALRASMLISFARHYLKVDPPAAREYVAKYLYDGKELTNTAIKADLNHVVGHWQSHGFDLWEEVNAHHFYTLLVQLRAMKDGAEFAKELSDDSAASKYTEAAKGIEVLLEKFWDAEKGYLVASLDDIDTTERLKSIMLDTANVLAILHAGHAAGKWNFTNDKVLATHVAIVDSMRSVFYPLNKKYEGQFACAVGRYPQDIYDGVGLSHAHPWFLCCLAHAEFLYRTAHALSNSTIEVTSISRGFYEGVAGKSFSPLPESIKSSSDAHTSIIRGIRARADDFVNIVRDWKGADGSMSEQFSMQDGTPRGARHLTWSYSAFLSMKDAREGKEMF